jgi:transcriptional regulator with XRE-family HTH domain
MNRNLVYRECGRVLVEARLKSGLTQTEVADRLGKTQSFVSKYESGERKLDVVEFLQVCRAINTSAEELLHRLESGR